MSQLSRSKPSRPYCGRLRSLLASFAFVANGLGFAQLRGFSDVSLQLPAPKGLKSKFNRPGVKSPGFGAGLAVGCCEADENEKAGFGAMPAGRPKVATLVGVTSLASLLLLGEAVWSNFGTLDSP